VTLTEALKVLQQTPKESPPFSITLACGFTPLHLRTFLAAHVQQALPDRRIVVTPGLYGDLAGCLEGLASNPPDAIAVAVEWRDLDQRLSYRGAGLWGPQVLPDIMADVRLMLDRIAEAIAKATIPVAISLPTVPLPPLFHTPGWQASEAELALHRSLAEFAERIAARPLVRVLSKARLEDDSPAAARFDLKSDLAADLPYTLPHADALGSLLARLLAPPAPKKGIITDLDDTLWRGIVGEVGPEGVSWDLASHHQQHGLYQKLLATLCSEGTLVAVASKNDASVVAKAFERVDLLLKPEMVFPMEVHWSSKSGSVERILRTWNIAADSVVFVDDSPMELAEVATAHPGIECVRFPTGDDREFYRILARLRDLFGKQRVSAEDSIRLESIRQGAGFREEAASGSASERFLEQAQAKVTFDFATADDPRVLELVNKTNQFNLNGIRYADADWKRKLNAPDAFVCAISYEDKFGPLGKIAVMQGTAERGRLTISTWVMSCRAFSRRIEFQCLKALLNRFDSGEVTFQFAATAKNGPTQEFFASLLGSAPNPAMSIPSPSIMERMPQLYHQVEDLSEIKQNSL
jgi:FkbH-like protein